MAYDAQEVHVLEKLIGSVVSGGGQELIAYKLLSVYGSAGQAVHRLNFDGAKTLGIHSKLAALFSSIRQLNLGVLYHRISDDPFPGCKRQIILYFQEQFPERQTYVSQYFYFCGDRFVGSGIPVKGTINNIEILKRKVFSEALEKNADRIFPVIGLPSGFSDAHKRILRGLEELGSAGEALEIFVEQASFI